MRCIWSRAGVSVWCFHISPHNLFFPINFLLVGAVIASIWLLNKSSLSACPSHCNAHTHRSLLCIWRQHLHYLCLKCDYFFNLVAGAEWQLCPTLSHRHGGFSERYRPLTVIKQTGVSAAGEKATLQTAGEQLGPNKDTGLKGEPVVHLCHFNKAP